MINKKSRDEIKRMIHAGHIVALVHEKMKEVLKKNKELIVAIFVVLFLIILTNNNR